MIEPVLDESTGGGREQKLSPKPPLSRIVVHVGIACLVGLLISLLVFICFVFLTPALRAISL